MKKEKLNKYLKREILRNISLIGFIKNNPIKRIIKVGESIAVVGKSDQFWTYIYSDRKNELKEVMNELSQNNKYFASIENWMLPIITSKFEKEWELKTKRYIFTKKSIDFSNDLNIRNLDKSFSKYIYENSAYKKYTSKEYISSRLEKGVSAGMFKDGKLIGWGLSHDDNALGFLNVLKEYRKNGYGEKILKALITIKKELDEEIFVNIEPDNYKSKNLVIKLGFEFDREISWIKLK